MHFRNRWLPLRTYWRQAASFCFTLVRRTASPSLPKVFVVVEGKNDIEFLRRMSTMLHTADPQLPNLAQMEQRRELVFMPSGGGDARSWAYRLAGLHTAECHIYDRDVSPVTEIRRQMADIVNCRPQCRAVLTHLRALENYLHPDAILEASGLHVTFSGDDHVAELVARKTYERQEGHLPWDALPARARKRRRDRAKTWLNTSAVERMTPRRLAEQDPDGEIRDWLKIIAHLAHGGE